MDQHGSAPLPPSLSFERTSEGLSVAYQGLFLYSRRAPLSGVRRVTDNLTLRSKTLYLLPSPLLGYGLSHLLEKLPADAALLLIESNEELMQLTLSHLGPQVLNDRRLFLLQSRNTANILSFLDDKGMHHYRRVELLLLNRGYLLDRQWYDELFSYLQQAVANYWQNRITEFRLGERWFRNVLTNLLYAQQARPLSALKTTRPVVVLGAGESLEETISWLLPLREKFFLLAVDTALPTLLKGGCPPHGVVNVEAQVCNLKDYYTSSRSPFISISDLSATPASLRRGETLYLFLSRFGSSTLWRRLYDAALLPPFLPPRGSVGVITLEIALRMTEREVFFTGLDFGYRLGKTHARGTEAHLSYFLNSHHRLLGEFRWYEESFLRPLRQLSENSYLRSDGVLTSYAQQIGSVIPTERLFDLRTQGIPLKVTKRRRKDLELLASSLPKRVPPYLQRQTSALCTAESLKTFFKEEQTLLLRLVQRIDQATRSKSLDGLLEYLKECDYTYFSFPDKERALEPRGEFLGRVVLSVKRYLRLLEHCRATLEGGVRSLDHF